MNTYLLHLETATKACSVAVSLNGQTVSLVESIDEEYSHGEKLGVFIEKALHKAKISPKELNAVSFSSGPGSYTGLRIGCSTAKGICFALQIPLIAIDSTRCIAFNARENHPKSDLLVLIDARRMEAYTQIFDCQNHPQTPIEAVILEENTFSEWESLIVVGDGAGKTKAIWRERNFQIDSRNYSSAKGQSSFAYSLFLEKKFVDLAYFEPLYLKEFIAKKSKSIL